MISRKEAVEKNLPRYFTGQPCKRGHISERRTKQYDCLACHNEKNRAFRKRWKKANPGKLLGKFMRCVGR